VWVDDETGKEGDLILRRQFATPSRSNFMVHRMPGAGGGARALICLAMEGERLGCALSFHYGDRNTDSNQRFTVSVDADLRTGFSTGISAESIGPDVQWQSTSPRQLPGSAPSGPHLSARARERRRAQTSRHTEAAVISAGSRLYSQSGVICESPERG